MSSRRRSVPRAPHVILLLDRSATMMLCPSRNSNSVTRIRAATMFIEELVQHFRGIPNALCSLIVFGQTATVLYSGEMVNAHFNERIAKRLFQLHHSDFWHQERCYATALSTIGSLAKQHMNNIGILLSDGGGLFKEDALKAVRLVKDIGIPATYILHTVSFGDPPDGSLDAGYWTLMQDFAAHGGGTFHIVDAMLPVDMTTYAEPPATGIGGVALSNHRAPEKLSLSVIELELTANREAARRLLLRRGIDQLDLLKPLYDEDDLDGLKILKGLFATCEYLPASLTLRRLEREENYNDYNLFLAQVGDNVLDIGGNRGFFPVFCTWFGATTGASYEPALSCRLLFLHNCRRSGFQAVCKAVDTVEGVMPMSDHGYSKGAGSSRSRKRDRDGYKKYHGVSFCATAVDFASCLRHHNPHVVKMDIETVDLDILLLASKCDWGRVRLLVVEFSTEYCRHHGGPKLFLDVLRELQSAGFTHCWYPNIMEQDRHWSLDPYVNHRKGYDDRLFFYRQGQDTHDLLRRSRREHELRVDWLRLENVLAHLIPQV